MHRTGKVFTYTAPHRTLEVFRCTDFIVVFMLNMSYLPSMVGGEGRWCGTRSGSEGRVEVVRVVVRDNGEGWRLGLRGFNLCSNEGGNEVVIW